MSKVIPIPSARLTPELLARHILNDSGNYKGLVALAISHDGQINIAYSEATDTGFLALAALRLQTEVVHLSCNAAEELEETEPTG